MRKRAQNNNQLYELYWVFRDKHPKWVNSNDYYVISHALRTKLYDEYYGDVNWQIKGNIRDIKVSK